MAPLFLAGTHWGEMRDDCGHCMKRLWVGVLVALLGAAPAIAEDPAQELVVNLAVNTDPVKGNGSPWDGYPAVDGRIIVPDPSNAPDIAVCVVAATGAPECVWRTERRRKLSHCPDSEKCTIPGIRLPALPIGLIFLDVDLVRHDLIDFVVLTGAKTDTAEIAKIEANLRAAMATLTPGGTQRERRHRVRKARILPLDLCVGATHVCDLSQSRFWLEKK
jgi:hypothetical protein